MKNNECKRRQYKFEINEVDLNFGPLLLSLEGGPGGTVSDAWDDVCGAASDAWDDVCGAASDLWESTCDFFEDPWSAITDPFGSCFDFLENTWASFVDFCEDTWEDIEEAFEDAWESVEEFCSDAWDTICDVWDDWGQQIVGIVAVVVCSWIPGVNAVVAAAVIGALQAGMESGWDLQAMAVGAAAGAISAYAGGIKTPGLSGTMAKVGCNAASGALKSGYASGWDLSEMGQGALTGGVAGYVSGNGKLDFFNSSSVAGKLGNNIIKNTAQSCAQNGFNEDALINGAASGVGSTVGGMAADGLDIENETMDGFVQSSISSATSQAIVAGAKGEDIGDAVTNSVKQAAVGAAMSYVGNAVNAELSKHKEDLDSSEIGKIGRNVITSTIDSCAKNGLNSDALVNGIANGVGNSLGEMAANEMGSENELAQNFVSSAVSSAASQALVAGATGGDVMLAVTNSLKNTTVKTAMKAMSDKLNSELSEHEADEKILEYCQIATDSVTAAVLSSINGGDFGATFEASLKANINKAIMSEAKSIMNAKVATHEQNQFSTNGLTSDVVSFAQSHSEEAFVAYIQATFGEDISDEAAAALYEDIQDGDLKMPKVKVSDEGLDDAEASYNRETDTIQISSDLVDSAQTNPMDAWKARIAVNEEIGHFLDDQLRNNYSNIGSQPGHVDAVGDEGARFARNVLSAASDEQLSQPLTITKEDGTAVKIDTDSALRDDALELYASDARIAHEDFSVDSNYEHFDSSEPTGSAMAFGGSESMRFVACLPYNASVNFESSEFVTRVANARGVSNAEALDILREQYADWDINKDNAFTSAVVILEKDANAAQGINTTLDYLGDHFKTIYQGSPELQSQMEAKFESAKAGDIINISEFWGIATGEMLHEAANFPGKGNFLAQKLVEGQDLNGFQSWVAGNELTNTIGSFEFTAAPPSEKSHFRAGAIANEITALSGILAFTDLPVVGAVRSSGGAFNSIDDVISNTSKSGVNTNYPERLAYRADLPEHLFGPHGFNKKGVLHGTHNQINAIDLLNQKGATYKLTPTKNTGISELEYSYFNPAKNKTITGSKTVYDPNVYSDQQMLDMSKVAGQKGFERYISDTSKTIHDISENGVNFRVYINFTPQGAPFVGNVHPIP